jgi:hypothetical protein
LTDVKLLDRFVVHHDEAACRHRYPTFPPRQEVEDVGTSVADN